ncbi:hypothetical protein HDU97_001018 [Phlyctochytrium planicorne]|nr:hypothetical protein HDU97_001018 [Phlyctochytrium planicorne]
MDRHANADSAPSSSLSSPSMSPLYLSSTTPLRKRSRDEDDMNRTPVSLKKTRHEVLATSDIVVSSKDYRAAPTTLALPSPPMAQTPQQPAHWKGAASALPLSPASSPTTTSKPYRLQTNVNTTHPSSTAATSPASVSKSTTILDPNTFQRLYAIVYRAFLLGNFPQHVVPLALLYASRLLDSCIQNQQKSQQPSKTPQQQLLTPTTPTVSVLSPSSPPMASPEHLLLAGLILSETILVDATLSMRSWASIASLPSPSYAASLKRWGVCSLGFDLTIDPSQYGDWLEQIGEVLVSSTSSP